MNSSLYLFFNNNIWALIFLVLMWFLYPQMLTRRGKDSNKGDESNKYWRGADTQERTYKSKNVSESYKRGADNQQEGYGVDKYGRGKDSKEGDESYKIFYIMNISLEKLLKRKIPLSIILQMSLLI